MSVKVLGGLVHSSMRSWLQLFRIKKKEKNHLLNEYNALCNQSYFL